MKKDDFCHINDNTKNVKRSLSIISLLNQAKITEINKDQSKLTQNKK